MSVWVAIAIYVVGIIISTIGFGAYLNPRDNFDKSDFALFAFMALLWPILLAVAIVSVISLGLFTFVISKPTRFLMYFGQDLRKSVVEWREAIRNKGKLEKEEAQK